MLSSALLVGAIVALLIVLDGGSLRDKWNLFSVGMAFLFWGAGAGLIGVGTAIWRE